LKTSPTFTRLGVFLSLCLLHAARHHESFSHPTLIAEEGTVFLEGILGGRFPWINAGYLNGVTAVTIKLLSLGSLFYLPFALSALANILFVANFAYFLLPQWEAILARKYRWAFVLFFLGFSPFQEGIGAFLYCFWSMAIGCGFLALEVLYLPEASHKHRWAKAGYVFAACLAGPAVFQVLIPLFIATRLKRSSWTKEPFFLALGLGGLIQAMVMVTHPTSEPKPSLGEWIQFPQAWLYQTHLRIVLPTLLSHPITNWVFQSRMLTYSSLLIFLGLASLLFFQNYNDKERSHRVLGLLAAAVLSTWLFYLGRGSMFDAYRSSLSTVVWGATRYSFVPGFFLILGFTLAFQNLRTARLKTLYASVLIPGLLLGGLLNFKVPDDEVRPDWHETAGELEAFSRGTKDSVDRPIPPPGWAIHLKRE
jgi:hypothetical protein